jgi:hypothetical protein
MLKSSKTAVLTLVKLFYGKFKTMSTVFGESRTLATYRRVDRGKNKRASKVFEARWLFGAVFV